MEDNNSLMAAEPTVAYGSTMYDTVIGYLHSSHMPMETKRAVYLQLQAEVADENLGYMKCRLKEYANLEPGWNGEDALPQLAGTSYVTIDNVFVTEDERKKKE